MEQAKYQTVLKIASDYGIDLQKAVQTSPDPRMWQLERQLHEERMARKNFNAAFKTEIPRRQRLRSRRLLRSRRMSISQSFEVTWRMLQSGIATSLQDAYDKAVWARPDLKSLVDKERTEAEKRAIEQARKAKAEIRRVQCQRLAALVIWCIEARRKRARHSSRRNRRANLTRKYHGICKRAGI